MGPDLAPGSEGEQADVSADHPEVVAELTALHERWKTSLASPATV